ALMAMPVGRPRLLLADKGYDGDAVRQDLLLSGIVPVIPPKANRKNPPPCDFKAYKDRNRIERMFNRLKQFRRIATRFDKTAKSFAAFLALAGCKDMDTVLCQQDLVRLDVGMAQRCGAKRTEGRNLCVRHATSMALDVQWAPLTSAAKAVSKSALADGRLKAQR
ncbi:Transposase, partial [Devosia psychrophila]